jgi:thioredoxin 1
VVLVDCWAEWCGACREFAPVFDRVAARYPEHAFAKLDTGAEEELVSSLGISHIPTLMLFRDGVLLFKQPGYLDDEGLDDILAQAASLDMDLVRAEIAADQGQDPGPGGASAGEAEAGLEISPTPGIE